MDRVRHPSITLPLIHEADISKTLARARDDAVRDLEALGVRLPALALPISLPAPGDDSLDALIDDVEECELVAADVRPLDTPSSDEEELERLPDVYRCTSAPGSVSFPVDARLNFFFSPRPSRIMPLPSRSSTVLDEHQLPVDKRRACAIVSMHPSVSADRVKRVQKMAHKQGNIDCMS